MNPSNESNTASSSECASAASFESRKERLDFGSLSTSALEWPTSFDLHHEARAHRAHVLGKMIKSAIRGLGAFARQAFMRYRRRRRAVAMYDMLRALDDRTLHDLGFDRSELTSVAAEYSGEAAPTRVGAVWLLGQSPVDVTSIDAAEPSASASTGSPRENEERAVRREASVPRIAVGLTAVAMMAMTLGATVIVPQRLEAGTRGTDPRLAVKDSAPGSSAARSVATIALDAGSDEDAAPEPCVRTGKNTRDYQAPQD
jgi:uncharacterized protein YjiS (DUF1127 family)